MALFSFVLSATKKRPIKGTVLTDALLLAPFVQGDSFNGQITVVTETGDVTDPTTPLSIDQSTSVALTDGVSVIYALASALGIVTGNVIDFSLAVSSAALTNALRGVAFLNAFFEVRGRTSGQESVLCREPVIIVATATTATGGFMNLPGLIPNPLITVLRSAPTALESMATLGIPVTTYLLTSMSNSFQLWQLTTGTASGSDLAGQVQALDDPTKYWLKIGGL